MKKDFLESSIMFLILLLYIGFSLSFVLMKASLAYSEPFFLVAVRMLFSALILYGWLYIRKERPKIKRSHWWIFLGAAAFNIYVTNTFELVGLQQCSAVKVALIFCFAPFLGALLSYFIWNERLIFFKWFGLGLGLLGILLLFVHSGKGSSLAVNSSDIWILGAMIGTTVGWTFVKRLVFDYKYSAVLVNAVTMLIGGVGALLSSFFIESWHPFPIYGASQFWTLVIGTSLLSCICCYNLYAWLLRMHSVVLMTFASFLSPFFTAIFGYFFLHETINATFVGSFILLMLGLVIFYKNEIKKESSR